MWCSCGRIANGTLITVEDVEALAELRRTTRIPIKADESVFTPGDAIRLVQHRAADIFSVYPGKHGGIGPTLQIAAIAKAQRFGRNLKADFMVGGIFPIQLIRTTAPNPVSKLLDQCLGNLELTKILC